MKRRLSFVHNETERIISRQRQEEHIREVFRTIFEADGFDEDDRLSRCVCTLRLVRRQRLDEWCSKYRVDLKGIWIRVQALGRMPGVSYEDFKTKENISHESDHLSGHILLVEFHRVLVPLPTN